MLGQDRRIIGWPLTILMFPALIYSYIKGKPMRPEYYPEKLEVAEREDVYAFCNFCKTFRQHAEVIWLMPFCETRECLTCGTLVEL